MVKKRIVVSVIALALLRKQSRKASRGKRRIWMKEWLKKRNAQGAYHQLMKELSTIDVSGYRNFVRMDSSTFELLHNMVAPIIQRQNTVMRESISPGERIAITLRFGQLVSFNYLFSYIIFCQISYLPMLYFLN